MGDFEKRGSNLEKRGWKKCQREGPIGKDRKIRRVIVTVDILLSGGRGGGVPMRRVGIERYTLKKINGVGGTKLKR